MKFTEKDYERFTAKVDKASSPNGCWLWVGCITPNNYGYFALEQKPQIASRASWKLFRGEIPVGIYVLHNCPGGDNPRCVNPNHLWLGTQKQNIRDAMAKGRMSTGDNHYSRRHPEKRAHGTRIPNHKLNRTTADEIKQRYATGNITMRDLSVDYGVCTATICHIIHDQIWRDDEYYSPIIPTTE